MSQNCSNSCAKSSCMRNETADMDCEAGCRLTWGKTKEIMTACSEENAAKKGFQ